MLIFHGRVKTFGSLERGFVLHHIGTDRRVAFDHVQRFTVEIPRPVEPRLVDETRHIDHERVAFPVASRPSHPCVAWTVPHLVHVNQSAGAGKGVGDNNLACSLDDLKRETAYRRRGARRACSISPRDRVPTVSRSSPSFSQPPKPGRGSRSLRPRPAPQARRRARQTAAVQVEPHAPGCPSLPR